MKKYRKKLTSLFVGGVLGLSLIAPLGQFNAYAATPANVTEGAVYETAEGAGIHTPCNMRAGSRTVIYNHRAIHIAESTPYSCHSAAAGCDPAAFQHTLCFNCHISPPALQVLQIP